MLLMNVFTDVSKTSTLQINLSSLSGHLRPTKRSNFISWTHRTLDSRCAPRGGSESAQGLRLHAYKQKELSAVMELQSSETVPGSYKRLVAESVGSSFREVAKIVEEGTPSPGDGEVLLKVQYAGINGGCETFRARGEYAFEGNKGKKDFPLGAEAVGTIVALGANAGELRVGQAVAVTGAGYAHYAVAKAAMCFPIQEASPEAVAVSLSGLTAAGALLYKAGLEPGFTVLVTAAAGGTGHFAVQVAKLKGCHVIATCGSKEKAQKLKEIGADRVINYHEEDVGKVLATEYSKKIDVAYEGVGGPLRDAVLANLSANGKVLAVGYISEYPHNRQAAQNGSHENGSPSTTGHTWDLPPADELMWQAQTLHNEKQTIYGQVWPKDPQQIKAAKQWLFEQYYAGAVKAWIDPKKFTGLDSVVEATEYMLSGKSIGKVVVGF